METNINGFLDGRVQIAQPRIGYRAATDPVYLAASVPAVAGDRVLDVGCGVGTASFCLGARVSNLIMAGIELQDYYAALAISNGVRNDLFLDVICAELQNSPPELRAQSFDHVMTILHFLWKTQCRHLKMYPKLWPMWKQWGWIYG